jgi:hypothetical protein
VYTRVVEVNSGLTGVFAFTVSADDIVPNGSSRTGSVRLDNEVPVLSLEVAPLPQDGDGLSGEVYQKEVLLTGEYADQPQTTRMRSVRVELRNEAGDHVNDSPLVLTPTEERSFSLQIELIDGHNAVTVVATDLVGNETTTEFVLDFIRAKETQFVDGTGGTVSAPDGTTVVIPANALLSRQEITISRIDIREFPKPLDESVRLIGNAHEFGPDGLVFYEPVEITLAYSDLDLDSNQDGTPDIPEEELNVFYWDGLTWIETEAFERSPSENTVSIMTNHFSVYALGHDTSADEFQMYWTRNPFVAGERTTAVMQLPEGGRVTLRIYDLEGDLVRTVVDEDVSGTTNRSWDGLSDFGDYVGSGIYIYTFRYVDTSGESRVIRKPIGVVE